MAAETRAKQEAKAAREAERQAELKTSVIAAQERGVCCATVRPTDGSGPQACGAEIVRSGFCHKHYLLERLQVRHGNIGSGTGRRPFWDYQVPLQHMSEAQLALAEDTERLPVSVSHAEFIRLLTDADEASPLPMIPPKDQHRARYEAAQAAAKG